MPRRVIDLSQPLSRESQLHPFFPPTQILRHIQHSDAAPGDPSFSAEIIITSNHAATHVDAFGHYQPGGAAILGVVTYASSSASFKPRRPLSSNTHYIATITTGARDLAGNRMASDYIWSFDTGANVDFIRPTVTSTNPVNGASSVPITQKVNATFSKLMNYASINTADFFLTSALWSCHRNDFVFL